MLNVLRLLREIRALVDQANALASPDGGPPRWSLAYTNRSFILAAVALFVQIAAAVGLPFPLPLDVAGETAWAIVSLLALGWSGVERVTGVTRAVWSRRQARNAADEAAAISAAPDALDVALRKAGIS